LKRIGILYNPRIQAARDFSEDTAKFLATLKASCWQCSSQDDPNICSEIEGTEMVLCVGGDGTVLRSARVLAPYSVPIVGVNLGKLGFLTELKMAEARDRLPALLKGEGWIDERAMIQVEVDGNEVLHGLNDVVVGRGARPRVINVTVMIDQNTFTTYKSDGVIVATATGSTGYSLALHGPILYPQAREIVLNPICPHPTFDNALVLSPQAVIELKVRTDHQAVLSVDGQVDMALEGEKTVKVSLSPYVTRLLRLQSRNFFYSTLVQRLVPKS
jgi:NAD+ kinase